LHDETGAQAAEYAMLGGVSAAACGGLVVVFNTSDLIPALASTVMDILSTFMGSWF
jgi:Flp pilus assembly pilin Flp